MNPQILKLWIDSRRTHVQYCLAMGIKFTEAEANAMLSILDELEDDFNLEMYAKEEYQLEKNF